MEHYGETPVWQLLGIRAMRPPGAAAAAAAPAGRPDCARGRRRAIEKDADGDLFVRLTKAEGEPLARPGPDRGEKNAGAPGLGDRLLVRFETLENGDSLARLIKRLGQSAHRILGVVRKERHEVRVVPVDRGSMETLILAGPDGLVLKDGDLVLAQIGGAAERRYGAQARQAARGGRPRRRSPRRLADRHSPPRHPDLGFSAEAEAEAEAARPPTLGVRTDLRATPLVTIDPPDARDHDDAVDAEPDDDARNPGGWIVWVAIADVAAYVPPRPGPRCGSAGEVEQRLLP